MCFINLIFILSFCFGNLESGTNPNSSKSVNEAHDLHLSKSEIRYKSDKHVLQISIHLFIDDLEDAIALYDSTDLSLCTDNEISNSGDFINSYVNERFKIEDDGDTLEMNFLGKELSEDLMAVWCYFEVDYLRNYPDLVLENTLITDLYDDQRNIVSFYVDRQNKKFKILDKDDTKISLSLL